MLLHGFPTSSFQYRELIPRLADSFRVIAPDLPGFGFTEPPSDYTYTFAFIARTIFAFTNALKLTHYALYVFDYGAPTGFRLALLAPERVTAIVSQNGNAYEEGLGADWAPIQRYWREPTLEHRNMIRPVLTLEGLKHEYGTGIPDPSQVDPAGYTLDAAILALPGHVDIQLDLFLDYANNVKMYPSFSTTSAPLSHRFWRSGANSTPTLSHPAQKLSGVTSPRPPSISYPLATLRSKHTWTISLLQSDLFFDSTRADVTNEENAH